MMGAMDFFIVYSEVCMAWCAFAGIVATLRTATGGNFTPEQWLMFRFFTECSIVLLMISMISIALLQADFGEEVVWRSVSIYTALTITFYMPFHLRRRMRLVATIHPFSRGVAVGYAILLLVMLVSLTEVWWEPSSIQVAVLLLYGLATNSVIFFIFLSSYVEVE